MKIVWTLPLTSTSAEWAFLKLKLVSTEDNHEARKAGKSNFKAFINMAPRRMDLV